MDELAALHDLHRAILEGRCCMESVVDLLHADVRCRFRICRGHLMCRGANPLGEWATMPRRMLPTVLRQRLHTLLSSMRVLYPSRQRAIRAVRAWADKCPLCVPGVQSWHDLASMFLHRMLDDDPGDWHDTQPAVKLRGYRLQNVEGAAFVLRHRRRIVATIKVDGDRKYAWLTSPLCVLDRANLVSIVDAFPLKWVISLGRQAPEGIACGGGTRHRSHVIARWMEHGQTLVAALPDTPSLTRRPALEAVAARVCVVAGATEAAGSGAGASDEVHYRLLTAWSSDDRVEVRFSAPIFLRAGVADGTCIRVRVGIRSLCGYEIMPPTSIVELEQHGGGHFNVLGERVFMTGYWADRRACLCSRTLALPYALALHRAACVIQRAWRRVVCDPTYLMCRHRLFHEFFMLSCSGPLAPK